MKPNYYIHIRHIHTFFVNKPLKHVYIHQPALCNPTLLPHNIYSTKKMKKIFSISTTGFPSPYKKPSGQPVQSVPNSRHKSKQSGRFTKTGLGTLKWEGLGGHKLNWGWGWGWMNHFKIQDSKIKVTTFCTIELNNLFLFFQLIWKFRNIGSRIWRFWRWYETMAVLAVRVRETWLIYWSTEQFGKSCQWSSGWIWASRLLLNWGGDPSRNKCEVSRWNHHHQSYLFALFTPVQSTCSKELSEIIYIF